MQTQHPALLERLRSFCDRAEAIGVNGLEFQHAALCQRRCWLHMRRAHMNEWSEHVRRGEARHADSHVRDHSVTGLMGLRPDRLDWAAAVVTEEKSSASHLDAAMDQVAFYAAALSVATGTLWHGRIFLSKERRHRQVALDEARLQRIEQSLDVMEVLHRQSAVPEAVRIQVCNGCSNADFCWAETG
jgi:CRISPR-associated exonuclease Cas4